MYVGVHPNINGYRIMGYAIPLNLFKTADTGFKVYTDSQCTREENYNDKEASNPYYEMSVKNIRRGTPKEIIRYVKNVGISPCLYYIYLEDVYNMNYYFIDENGNKTNVLYGLQNPNLIKKIKLVVESQFDDYISDFKLRIVTRDLTSIMQ